MSCSVPFQLLANWDVQVDVYPDVYLVFLSLQIGIFGETSTKTLPPRILPPPRHGIVVLANFEIPPRILGVGLGGRVEVCSWPPQTFFCYNSK